MKKIFLILFFIPYFAFAQNFPQGEGGISDSLLPGKDELNDSVTTPLPGVNDDELLIPKDVAPPTTQNSGQFPNTNTSFTPSRNDFSAGMDTSILNQPAPNYPTVPAPTNVAILDQIVSGSIFQGTPLNKVLNQLFYIGLVAAIILAIVMIIKGGIEYMTVDSITSKESGKKRVQAALGGLVLAFSAILILNTVNPGLTSLSLQFEQLQGITGVNLGTNLAPTAVSGWSKDENGNYIKKQTDGSTLVVTPDGKKYTVYPDGSQKEGLIQPDGTPALALNGQTEEEVRNYFKQNGISINAPAGTTNVQGLGEAAIRGIVDLKNASGASIIVTGGTEDGHKTHGVGQPIADLHFGDPTLDNYIINNASSIEQTSLGPKYIHANGTSYLDERNGGGARHWHAVFK